VYTGANGVPIERAYLRLPQIKRELTMRQLNYLGVLAFIGACAIFITLTFRIRVKKFWKIFLATDLLILAIYLVWDYWAIYQGNWYFDTKQILDLYLFGKIPVEEILFFIIVPLTTLLTYLALTKITKWIAARR
jgi:lycopene cyclase domain-containing protein